MMQNIILTKFNVQTNLVKVKHLCHFHMQDITVEQMA